jgi:hypothetical protein
MLTLKQLKKIDPSLSHITDEDLEAIRSSFYNLGELMFEDWRDQKLSSKNHVGLLTNEKEEHTM